MISFAEFKKFFIFTFIGSLIIAALAAVVVVLTGQFNEITGRVFVTLFMVILHSLISLLFIWDDSRRNTFNKLSFFVNTIFVLIILSFITSLFGTWKIITSQVSWHLYQTFFLIGFASLHGDILSKAIAKEKYMDMIVYANYLFIVMVVLLFIPIIFINNSLRVLDPMYFRVLAAAGIIDGTLSILTVIFYKLYMHKHPEVVNPVKHKGLSVWIWILIIFLLFQIIGPFSMMLGGLSRWR